MVRSLGFLGVRTKAFGETSALYRDVLGLEPILERPGADPQRDAGVAWNQDRGPDGNVSEIILPDRSAA